MNIARLPQTGPGRRRAALLAAVFASGIAAASCNLPFGPGYKIERQRLEVGFVRSPQPHVEVRGVWRVKNTGDRPLTALELRLPDAKKRSVSMLRVESGGSELSPAPAASGNVLRIVFHEPLATKARQEIAVSYALAGDAGGGVVVDDAGFVLPPGDWAPSLMPPSAEGPFAHASGPPKKWELTVRAPAGFRVYASGRERGEKREADSAVFRFSERQEEEFSFAVGGAFQEAKIAAGGSEVILWTRQEMPRELAEHAAATVRRTAEFYDSKFGTRDADARALRIIECPAAQPCWPVPGAVLPGRELYTQEFWSSGVRTMDRQLALTWLDFRVHPAWDSELLPMGALADFAADLAAAAREGDDARRRVVHDLVGQFDGLRLREPEPSVLAIRKSDPAPVGRLAAVKSELFIFALEDVAGSENFSRALVHLLRTYEGRNWLAADLRSALEQESGKDLGPLFRRWLIEPGIPAEFRNRYAGGARAPGGAH